MFTNQRDAAEIEGIYKGSRLLYSSSEHQYIPVAVLNDILINGHYRYARGLCVYTKTLAQLGKLQPDTLIRAVNAHYAPYYRYSYWYQVIMAFNDVTLGIGVGLFPLSRSQITAYVYASDLEVQDRIRRSPKLPNITHIPKVTLYGLTVSQFYALQKTFSYKLYVAKLNWVHKQTHFPRFECRRIVGGLFSQKSWTALRQWLCEHTGRGAYRTNISDNSLIMSHIYQAEDNGQRVIDSKMPQRIQMLIERLGIPERESRKERKLQVESHRKAYRQQKQHDAELRKRLTRKHHLKIVKRRNRERRRREQHIRKMQRRRRILVAKLRHDFSTLFTNRKLLGFYQKLDKYLSRMKLKSAKFNQLKKNVRNDVKDFSKQRAKLNHCSTGDDIQRLAVHQAFDMMDLLNTCNGLQINHPKADLKELCFKIRKLSAGVNKAMNQKLIESPIVKTRKYLPVSKKLNHLQKRISGHYSKYDVWYGQQEARFSQMITKLPKKALDLQKRQLKMNQRRGLLHGYKSYGEQEMKAIFDAHKVSYRHGYRLKNKLHLDFFLPEYSVGIEIDGEPHFHGIQYKNNFSLAEIRKRFDTQRKRDKAKDVYCKKHRLCLIRIQYIDENFLYIEWVQKHVLRKLNQSPKGRVVHVGNLYGFNNIVNSITERK